jgi:fructokinase
LNTDHKIVGIGEVLFDILPSKERMPGGAPANFAWIAGQLGNRGIIASRVGEDSAGREILVELETEKNTDTSFLQKDPQRKTGSVRVSLQDGQPVYEIVGDVAWDYLELTSDWRELAGNCDAVCFGSLAQRSGVLRATIQKFVQLTKPECLRVFDINLRQNHYSKNVLQKSLELAYILKLKHEKQN